MEQKVANLQSLIEAVVNGENDRSVVLAECLVRDGWAVERLIHEGLTAVLRSLDAKCTNEEFNLLEIMLAGRAMMAVMDKVVAKHLPAVTPALVAPGQTIVLGTIKGDIHELGKHVVKMLLKANGFKVIDIGKDVHPANFVKREPGQGADGTCYEGDRGCDLR